MNSDNRTVRVLLAALGVVGLGAASASLGTGPAPRRSVGRATGTGSVEGTMATCPAVLENELALAGVSLLLIGIAALYARLIVGLGGSVVRGHVENIPVFLMSSLLFPLFLVTGLLTGAGIASRCLDRSLSADAAIPPWVTVPDWVSSVGESIVTSVAALLPSLRADPMTAFVLFGGLVATLLGFVLLFSVTGGGDRRKPEQRLEVEPDPNTFDTDAEGTTLGTPGDPDPDNAVYQAWLEILDRLEIEDPDAKTPGEIEEAAAEAGLREADVRTITRLFMEVRYGEYDPRVREAEANAALRNLESRREADGT